VSRFIKSVKDFIKRKPNINKRLLKEINSIISEKDIIAGSNIFIEVDEGLNKLLIYLYKFLSSNIFIIIFINP
jgi:hypothetical protein